MFPSNEHTQMVRGTVAWAPPLPVTAHILSTKMMALGGEGDQSQTEFSRKQLLPQTDAFSPRPHEGSIDEKAGSHQQSNPPAPALTWTWPPGPWETAHEFVAVFL